MTKFIKKKWIIILVVALVVALVSVITLNTGGVNSDVTSRITNTIMRPVRGFMNSLVNGLEQIYGYMYEYDRIVEENSELKDRIAKLEEEYREYTEISAENERLRKLFELSERHSDFKYVDAEIISWGSSNWTSTFTLNKGSNAGLALNDCVITESGYVVGTVTELGATSCTVTTVIDPSTSMGVIVYETSGTAVCSGDFSLMVDGMLRLEYMQDSTDVVAGYTLYTSGAGGMFPQGLVIGEVAEMVTSPSGLGDYATVIPSVDFDSLAYVYVISDFNIG